MAFAWHERSGAFERLTPPWERVEILERTGGIRDGDRVRLRVQAGPGSFVWLLEHRGYRPDREFRDVQIRGPFAAYEHTHRIDPTEGGGSILTDHVEYVLPGGAVGTAIGDPVVRRRFSRMFDYRHRVVRDDLAQLARVGTMSGACVAVTGASGLIGRGVVAALRTAGARVIRLVRRPEPGAENARPWDPDGAGDDPVNRAAVAGTDVVVHLAGESIARRWSRARKDRILRSRVDGTRTIATAVARAPTAGRPTVLVCASAIGWYGPRAPAEIVDESTPRGDGFLANVVEAWEAAAEPARAAGCRVANLRFGVVLSPAGGALQSLLRLSRFGLAGPVGSGRHVWSWIALDDVVGAVVHAVAREEVRGPVNVTAPAPVTNRAFSRVLASVLRRPIQLPAPALGIRLVLGEMGEALLLAGANVAPSVLLRTGYRFRFPHLEPALRHLLGRPRPTPEEDSG